MPRGRLEPILRQLRRAAHPDPDLTDDQLLERYVSHHDADAFALIVRRHGGLVRSVCRHVLGHDQDADDAFQATFLVLASQAASIRKATALASFLHGVAYRTAANARRARARRSGPIGERAAHDADQPATAAALREVQAILDEEVSRLPEKWRAPFVLCCLEGKSRAEAARELALKEGTISSRIARARTELQQRLSRRGVALSAALAAVALSRDAGHASELLTMTIRAALAFAGHGADAAPLISVGARTLAAEVLRTTSMIRIKNVALLTLAVAVVSLGIGLGLHRVVAKPPDEAVPPRQEVGAKPGPAPEAKPAAKPADPEPPVKPLRVLLFAAAPTREYQMLRTLLINQSEKKQVELSICLQSGGGRGVVQDVPPERMLKRFPTRLTAGETKEDADDKYGNLGRYDVAIAIDPDWTQLTEEQMKLLEQWVGKEGRGLIHVAGPIHTLTLARASAVQTHKPILDLLPVRLQDSRLVKERDTSRPWSLAFPATEKFLKLDREGKGSLAGWSEFFFDKSRDDWQTTEDRPERGFYTAYPVKSVKPGARVLATFRDPDVRIALDGGAEKKDLPYLVARPYGQGQTVYLGSGELWRLRQFNEDFYDRFWSQLARYAASSSAASPDTAVPRAPAITPEQRKAADKGLAWLVRRQHRDGHWEGTEGTSPVTMTALSGTALLMQGSTIGEGEYAGSVRRAVDWLMSRSQPNGLIGKPSEQDEKVLEGHSRALLFLVSVFGEEEDADRRRRLQNILTRAVQFTVKAQTSGGGWGRFVRGLHKEGDDKADVGPTVVQLQALRAARGVGIEVPKKVLDAGRHYLEKTIDATTATAILGLAGAFGSAEYNTPVVKKWLRGARKLAPALGPEDERRVRDDLALYNFTLLAYSLGDDGYARLLPETKAGERIIWSDWRKKVFDDLAKTQKTDGSWESDLGPVHATALHLAILQLDYGVLPIFQR
jgi:RNA polymerase sigma factor (sigma-70 family)